MDIFQCILTFYTKNNQLTITIIEENVCFLSLNDFNNVIVKLSGSSLTDDAMAI